MINERKRSIWMTVMGVVLFAIVLTTFRVLWMNAFTEPEHYELANGELDLRGVSSLSGQALTLTGEWSFYPYQLFNDIKKVENNDKTHYINVPQDWSADLNPENESPYGYASYHLRIFVDATEDATFSMRIPSVRSASALYANGVLVGSSGEVGESNETSHARNVPYSSKSIRPNEAGVIDIVLQASNYADPRSSGLVRAVTFGYEEDVMAVTDLSSDLQVMTGIIFFIHAVFAVIIFLVGFRDKRFLYFALLILFLAIINLGGGDEKVLFQYVTLDYTATFKLSMFGMFLIAWSLAHCVEKEIQAISRFILPIYTIIFIICTLGVVFLPIEFLASADILTFGIVFVGLLFPIIGLIRARRNFRGGIWISFAIIAVTSNYAWWAYMLATGMKAVYYPFDLIIAIICLVGVWFEHYHQMHLAMKNQAMKLAEADKVKDEFLATTSHELRNPLHSILNMSQGILERERDLLQSKSIENLETVMSVSQHMSILLDELLEISRLEDSHPRLHIQAISLQATTKGVIDMLAFMVDGKPVEIVDELPDDLPPVMADESRLVQIIFNLLHNAIKYTPSGEIVIRARVKRQKVTIFVIDSGMGMSEASKRTIFEPYVQSPEGKNQVIGGFGLGLSICKRLVELHDEVLFVESTLGKGTTFRFSLPLAKSEVEGEGRLFPSTTLQALHPEMLEKRNEEKMQTKRIPSETPRIIVVDDDPVNLQVMETLLSNEAYDIRSVLTAKEALSLLDEQEWDLIISDVMMPEMSGYQLTKLIRKRFTMSELPILLVTARNQQADIENGFLSGANDYVTKPVDAAELRARVKVLTDVKRISRERLRMELAWLQAQIKPHFLFNTLNAVIALKDIDTDRMEKLLIAFSKVLRSKYDFKEINDLIPIREELNLIESYVYIQKERFGDRLKMQWEVEDSLYVKIPALSIQPLVENAIEHGVMQQKDGGVVTIKVVGYESYVEICIVDNGIGMENEILESLLEEKNGVKSGVGILNTHRRLLRLLGKGLTIESERGLGTEISFRVPYRY